MATYIMLGRYTEAGVQGITEAPARIAANTERARAAGIEIKGVYVTMGEYDQVVIFEAPNDAVAMAALVGLGLQGSLRSTTLRAFTMEEFGAILGGLSRP
jgi:uncharacterized protein with GYD domain